MPSPNEIRTIEFHRKPFPFTAYSMNAVRAWLQQTASLIERRDGSITPEDIDAAEFPQALIVGYDTTEVDNFLDDIKRAIQPEPVKSPSAGQYGFRPFLVEPRDMSDAELEGVRRVVEQEARRRGM